MIEVHKSETHGFGVFSTQKIKKGTVVISSPCVNVAGLGKIYKYAFPIDAKNVMLPLDRASLINGSKNANVESYFKDELLYIRAIKNIDSGDELLLRYFK